MPSTPSLCVVGWLTVLLVGCAAGREIYWDEVVQASTGELFTVKRREVRRYVTDPGQMGGWLFQEATIEGELPRIGAVRWQTSLQPWLLDQAKDGRWYFIAMRGSYQSKTEYGLFDGKNMGPHFVFYRHRAGDWERILANDLPPEFSSPNLLVYGSDIFDPDPRDAYWRTDPPPKRGFWNGERLELKLKQQINISHHPDSAWMYHLEPGWRLDHGNRQLSECITGGPCDAECWKHGGPCRSVKRFEIGQELGRPPKSPVIRNSP